MTTITSDGPALSRSTIDTGLTTTITSGALTLSLSSATFMDGGSPTTITSGGLTKGNTLALSGTVSNVNSSVRVYDGATLLGTATFSAEDPHSWGFVTAVLPDGSPSTVSGSISLPCSGFFSPFPHGTGSLSVSQEYLALPDGAGRFPQGVSDLAVLRILTILLFITRTQLSCSMAGFPTPFRFCLIFHIVVLQPPLCRNIMGLGCLPFRSPLLRKSLLFSLPLLT